LPPKLRGQRVTDLTLAACMRCVDFWLLCTAMCLGSGCALVLVNNLAQLSDAIGSRQAVTSLVALFSVCNASGRLLQGALSDFSLRMGSTPPINLVIGLLLMACTQLALARATPATLPFCVAITGLCFGSYWSFVPVAAGELFGGRHAGSIYGVIGASPALGSFLLNTLVAGRVYDRHTLASPPPALGAPPPRAARCEGEDCFALTFAICSSTCVFAALCAYVLLVRTRHMYVRTAPATERLPPPP